MTKNITYLIYKIIFFFLKILDFIFKRRFSYVFKDIIVENSYEKIFLNNKKIYFFIPNTITKYRLDTFFSKEPKTLKWIQGFNKKSIFYDIGANVGNYSIFATIMNPFGRKQETEADYLGLIFSSLSGYDIRESVKLWERMAAKNKGKEPPVFLSTHPSSQKRIENLEKWITEVIVKYPPIPA